MSENEPNNLTSKDVEAVGKDVARTTLVWTLAGIATETIKNAIKIFIAKKYHDRF